MREREKGRKMERERERESWCEGERRTACDGLLQIIDFCGKQKKTSALSCRLALEHPVQLTCNNGILQTVFGAHFGEILQLAIGQYQFPTEVRLLQDALQGTRQLRVPQHGRGARTADCARGRGGAAAGDTGQEAAADTG